MNSDSGFNNLQWFIGIIEDIDRSNSGRVKVRCFGIHPPYDTGEVKTEDLPWAIPIDGSYGKISQIPKVSDWVFGFFIDGRDAQHPMLLGTIPGQNLADASGTGSGNHPYSKPSQEYYENYGVPPLHPAITGENILDTPVPLQNASRKSGKSATEASSNPDSNDSRGWEEPPSIISEDPAKTTVFYSRYGESYLELSGSKNNQGINISHPSGSQVQIDHGGNVKIKSFGDSYYISEGNSREYAGGRKDLTIEGKWSVNVTGGDATLEVTGNLNHVVHGDYNLNVAGRMAVSVGTGMEMAAQRISMESTAEHINLVSAEKIKISAGSSITQSSGSYISSVAGAYASVKSGSGLYLDAEGALNLVSGVHVAADAPKLQFNSGLSNPAPDMTDVPASPQVDQPTSQGIATSGGQGGVITEGAGSAVPPGGSGGSDYTDDTPGTGGTGDILNDVEQGNSPVDYEQGKGLEALLTFISSGEGGYESSNRGTSGGRIIGSTNSTTRNGKALTSLTFSEIFELQSISDPRNTQRLFAIGRYQIIPSTLRTVFQASGLSLGDTFNKENQDLLGTILIIGANGFVKRPTLAAYIRNTSDDLQGAMLDFAKEWASAPDPRTGRSYYGSGNRSSHSVSEVSSALKQARDDFANSLTTVA